MPTYSASSSNKLLTCNPRLQELFNEAILHYDHTVLCGHRDKNAQDGAFHMGTSKLLWPHSKHNSWPSNAVDAIPWHRTAPHIRWEGRQRMCHFAGVILGLSIRMGIPIRWGGDWDSDTELDDQDFFDFVHFELLGNG